MEEFLRIFQSHVDLMAGDIRKIADSTYEDFPIRLTPQQHLFLAKAATQSFKNDEIVMELVPPIVIVGDIHGCVVDLYRILKSFGLPPKTKYLFLGDMIDRGPNSLATLSLIFIMKVLFPSDIHVILGNHEFKTNYSYATLFSELDLIYEDSSLYAAYTKSFEYIPLAAKIGRIFCCHGGLSPNLMSISQIRAIKRPILDYKNPIVAGLTWSDPVDSVIPFLSSTRGVGFKYSEEALVHFLDVNNLSIMIRGHEHVDGCQPKFGGKLITVKSFTYKFGLEHSACGVVSIKSDYSIEMLKIGERPLMRQRSASQATSAPTQANVFFDPSKISSKLVTRKRAFPPIIRPSVKRSMIFSDQIESTDS